MQLMGQEWIFFCLLCSVRLVEGCKSCCAVNTAVDPPILGSSTLYKAPYDFVPLCATLVLHMDCGTTWQPGVHPAQ